MLSVIQAPSPNWFAFLLGISVLLFLLSTIKGYIKPSIKADLTALGLAVFSFAYFWIAVAQASH